MIPSQRKYDVEQQVLSNKNLRKVRAAYLQFINDVVSLYPNLSVNSNDEFYFRNNQTISKQMDRLLRKLSSDVYGVTVLGINESWELANEKQNELAAYAFKGSIKDIPKKYLQLNEQKRLAFIKRKFQGLKLSERVWNNTKQIKTEIELALEVGINSGVSASTLAADIKNYLNEPDRLYRRVRDKNGVLRLSKAAKAYHPGQGVYRSSYKNALRVTRNETNFAYEASQKEKRSQQPFIVGVKIQTSAAHNVKDDRGGISCQSLAGNYPKGFDFTCKWHVNCKCYTTSIIKSATELQADTALIIAGKEPNTKSSRAVDKQPENFNNYVKNNKDKWKNWKTKPLWL